MGYKVLIAEDEKDIQNILKIYLESAKHEVILANNGQEALDLININNFDCLLVDIMMPKVDGYSLIKYVRKNNNIPILVLSAKCDDSSKILGLNLGADDYISKPFNPLEIIARVNALIRRYHQFDDIQLSNIINYKNITLETDTFIVKKNNQEIILTPNEFKILQLLIKEPGKVFSKNQICRILYGDYYDNYDNAILVHIAHLREKIEDDIKNPSIIITVRGIGYKVEK